MVVWWTYVETRAPYDSYHYSNCQDSSYAIDVPCPATYSGGWQIGYGQQYSNSLGNGLAEAFQKTHGDANDASLVAQVGQNVLSKSGITKTFPQQTIAQLMSDEPANRYWIFTLSRDPAISVYLTAKEVKGDIDSGSSYYHTVEGWGAYYTDAVWQQYSNAMNDVLTNWGLAASSTPGLGCTSATTVVGTSCSTIKDNLQGMTAEQFVAKINANMAAYKQISACANVPWQMMAAIHLRETGLDPNYRGAGLGGAEGPWQIDPTGSSWGTVDPYDFVAAGCAVAKIELQQKAQSGPVGRPLTADMDPDNHDNEVSIKDAFFAYNGRGGYQINVGKGCTENFDGHSDWNFDCSAYVMNNWDANHIGMCIGTAGDPVCQDQDGTWKVYYKLVHSTYSSDGKLLVYGGQCVLTTGVVNGLAIPTAPNTAITSPFWVAQGGGLFHIGIDIANPEGQPVFAIANGDIINSGWDDLGGYYVLEHVPANVAGNSNERWVYYGHLDSSGFPAPGSQVKAGQQIGRTGPHMVNHNGQLVQNGDQTGPHLHFDIRTTTSGAMDPSIHVNPCSIDLFKQSYPGLDCSTYGNLGVAWK
jgi:hypothetical protein